MRELELARSDRATLLQEAVAMCPMPRLAEDRQLLGVHVQQRAGLSPLVAARDRRPRRAPPPRTAVTPEHLVDRRAAIADDPSKPRRSQIRPLARLHDPALDRLLKPPRTRARHRRASTQARPRDPVSVAGLLPAMPPPVRCGRRNRTRSRRGSQRAPTLDQTHQLQTAGHAELASTVFHVRSPLEGQSSLTAPSIGDRTSLQTFTKSVGSSPSRRSRACSGRRPAPAPHRAARPSRGSWRTAAAPRPCRRARPARRGSRSRPSGCARRARR